jgi:hypothetical protein
VDPPAAQLWRPTSAGCPPCRAADTGGNGTISSTELFQLFERLGHPIRWGAGCLMHPPLGFQAGSSAARGLAWLHRPSSPLLPPATFFFFFFCSYDKLVKVMEAYDVDRSGEQAAAPPARPCGGCAGLSGAPPPLITHPALLVCIRPHHHTHTPPQTPRPQPPNLPTPIPLTPLHRNLPTSQRTYPPLSRAPPRPPHTPPHPTHPGVIDFPEFLRMFRSELLDLQVGRRWEGRGVCRARCLI